MRAIQGEKKKTGSDTTASLLALKCASSVVCCVDPGSGKLDLLCMLPNDPPTFENVTRLDYPWPFSLVISMFRLRPIVSSFCHRRQLVSRRCSSVRPSDIAASRPIPLRPKDFTPQSFQQQFQRLFAHCGIDPDAWPETHYHLLMPLITKAFVFERNQLVSLGDAVIHRHVSSCIADWALSREVIASTNVMKQLCALLHNHFVDRYHAERLDSCSLRPLPHHRRQHP
jgi:hypothetical protein